MNEEEFMEDAYAKVAAAIRYLVNISRIDGPHYAGSQHRGYRVYVGGELKAECPTRDDAANYIYEFALRKAISALKGE